jgi:murein DD-endopeptidase MepM/ murein hydrolase activator NlpD
MAGFNLEPVVYCLFASLAWAPVVYLAATRLDRDRKPATSELIWLAALGAAVLPTLLAPALAAAGVSLRSAPVETIVGVSSRELMIAAAAIAANPQAAPAPIVSLDVIVKVIGLLYIYGVILALLVWAARAAGFALHVRRAQPTNYPELRRALDNWRARLGVASPVRLCKSEAVSSVCVYGLRRPVILIPAELDARISFDDLVLMGAHELAHIKRSDCLLFAVCSFSRILFWFNPFVKRLASRAELAAERSADRLVLEAGADRRAYAACFVEGLKFAAERAREARVAVPSFTPFDRRSRRERLDAILSGKASEKDRPSKLFLAAAVTSAAVLAFAQAALAVDPEKRGAEEEIFSATPLDGEVTLAFGDKIPDDIGPARPAHEGVDIKAAKGAPVTAPADGVVVEATDVYQGKPSWGKVVVIRHRNGVVTRYAHLDSYSVKRGDRVEAGDVIAAVGDSGAVTGPHLHFETIVDGESVDPQEALAGTGGAEPAKWAAAALAPVAPTAPVAASPAGEQPPRPAAPAQAPVAPAAAEAPAAPQAPSAESAAIIDAPAPERAFVIKSGNGEQRLVVRTGKDSENSYSFELSDEDRKRLNESLDKMRGELEKAKQKHKRGVAELKKAFPSSEFMQFDFDELAAGQIDLGDLEFDAFDPGDLDLEWFDFDASDFGDFDAALNAEDKAALRRWQSEHKRAMQLARREIERATRQAEIDGERARRDAERAKRDVERAERDAERARRGGEAREEELRRRAEGLEQAERNLAAERARIERMLADIAAKRERKNPDR